METLTLNAKKRERTGRQAKQLRHEGFVPAVVYGHGIEPGNLAVEARAFDKLYERAGESSLVDLVVDGAAPVKVLIQEVQYEPLRHVPVHVDFRQVKMDEKLEADVPLTFVGESPAVKNLGAILVRNMDAVTVSCLPNDLVHEIEVDLSALKEFGDTVTIGDIATPPGIEFIDETDAVIAVANEPLSEEELEASLTGSTEVDVTQVKSATEEKKEEAEAAAPEEKKAAE